MLSLAEENRKLCGFLPFGCSFPLAAVGGVNLLAQDLEGDNRPKHSGKEGDSGDLAERGPSLS